MDVFEESIDIQAPVELCYQVWRDFEAYPEFIHNVKSVMELDSSTWQYEFIGPEGDVSTWTLQLIEDKPNQLISWRTLEGPELQLWIDSSFIRLSETLTHATITVALGAEPVPVSNIIKNLFGVTQQTIQRNISELKNRSEIKTQEQITHGSVV